ncbi:hypothetical protein [Pantoea sp.]|uniref:hypothetical protein n=1 Tax=Pantoea sp. TaxID=69393 RepID=UPI0028ADDFC0|nr:hypothetical protein [Pantoea sp.]
MPDYRLYQKGQTIKAVNLLQQDALAGEGYRLLWNEVHADNAEAALLRFERLQQEDEQRAQEFSTDSIISSVINLIAR